MLSDSIEEGAITKDWAYSIFAGSFFTFVPRLISFSAGALVTVLISMMLASCFSRLGYSFTFLFSGDMVTGL